MPPEDACGSPAGVDGVASFTATGGATSPATIAGAARSGFAGRAAAGRRTGATRRRRAAHHLRDVAHEHRCAAGRDGGRGRAPRGVAWAFAACVRGLGAGLVRELADLDGARRP